MVSSSTSSGMFSSSTSSTSSTSSGMVSSSVESSSETLSISSISVSSTSGTDSSSVFSVSETSSSRGSLFSSASSSLSTGAVAALDWVKIQDPFEFSSSSPERFVSFTSILEFFLILRL